MESGNEKEMGSEKESGRVNIITLPFDPFFGGLWLQWIPDSCRLILAYDNSNDGQEMCGQGFLLLKLVKQRPLFESSAEECPKVGVHEKLKEFIWQI